VDWSRFVPVALAYLLALSWHESAHAWTAWRLGDWTGKSLGRISLNPIRHVDPFGTILLPLILWLGSNGHMMFGYAKPVPYNPYALRNGPLGAAMVAGAGPVSNLVLALISALVLAFLVRTGAARFEMGFAFLIALIVVNVTLAVFNLIPVPPLDGGTVLGGVLPRGAARVFAQVEFLGIVVLVALMASGLLGRLLALADRTIVVPLLRLSGLPGY
jgi:Zn-dependent protease